MRKSIVLCLALVLSLFAVTGSIAYFTDTIEVKGEAKSGNLDIEQFEFERNAKTGTLQPYTQGQAIYPAVGTPNHPTTALSYTFTATVTKNGTEETVNGEFSAKLMDTDSLRGFVDKIVVVKNLGNLPVYVRTFVAVPSDFDEAIVLDWNLGTSENPTGWVLSGPFTDNITDITNNIDNVPYTIWYATYNEPLAANTAGSNDESNDSIAPPSLLGFHLKPDFKNEKNATELKILVATQAAQVIPTGIGDDGAHDDAVTSLKKTYDTVDNDKVTIVHPWAPQTQTPTE